MPKSTRTTALARTRPLALIIEDTATQLDLYAMVIADEFSVLTATRGETGDAIARAEHPDVIVVDVLPPDIDGLRLCDPLRDEPLTMWIPLIVLIGDAAAFARASVMWFLDAVLLQPCPADHSLATTQRAIATRAVR